MLEEGKSEPVRIGVLKKGRDHESFVPNGFTRRVAEVKGIEPFSEVGEVER